MGKELSCDLLSLRYLHVPGAGKCLFTDSLKKSMLICMYMFIINFIDMKTGAHN